MTPNGSLKIGDTIVNDGGLTIKMAHPVTKTGINAGNLNITNVKAGVNDTDAVNVKQLKDSRTVVTSNDKSVTVNKTENGNQVTYDLHVAPGAAQSVWNVKSTGNTTADSEAAAKLSPTDLKQLKWQQVKLDCKTKLATKTALKLNTHCLTTSKSVKMVKTA